MSKEIEELIEYLKECGKKYLCNQYYMLYKHEIEKLVSYIEQLQKQNADLKEHYNNMFECHCNRVQVEQLETNWNELKKWLEDNVENVEWTSLSEDYLTGFQDILNKMQELELGKDE